MDIYPDVPTIWRFGSLAPSSYDRITSGSLSHDLYHADEKTGFAV